MRKISIEEVIYQYPKRKLNDSDIMAQVVVGQHSRGVRWWAAGALFGLAGAFLLPLVAELIAHHSGGLFASSSFFQKLPTRSTISIPPLLILGGFCLFQAVKRSTPEPDSCSPRQLPNTTKKRSGRNPVVLALLFVLCFRSSYALNDKATLTHGILKKEQNTATVGLVWWLGRKKGTW